MAREILDDFEEGPDGVPAIGDSSGTSLMRRGGYVLPGGQEYAFTASRAGGTPGLAVYAGFGRASSAWRGWLTGGSKAEMALEPAEGLGFYFARGDRWASSTETSSGFPESTVEFDAAVSIGWSSIGGFGGIAVTVRRDELVVTTEWGGSAESGSTGPTSYSLTPPSVPADRPVIVFQGWLEFGLSFDDGWFIRHDGGATIAAGSFPSGGPVARRDIAFTAQAHSNPTASSTDIRRNPSLLIDDIFGWPGLFGGAAAVRLFPRDDGLGMSSAPRRYPTPKSARVVGGYP